MMGSPARTSRSSWIRLVVARRISVVLLAIVLCSLHNVEAQMICSCSEISNTTDSYGSAMDGSGGGMLNVTVEDVRVTVNDECNSFTRINWTLRGDSVMLSEVNFTITITDSMGNLNRIVNIHGSNCINATLTCGEHLTEFNYYSIDGLGVNGEYNVSIRTTINETNTIHVVRTPVVSILAITTIEVPGELNINYNLLGPENRTLVESRSTNNTSGLDLIVLDFDIRVFSNDTVYNLIFTQVNDMDIFEEYSLTVQVRNDQPSYNNSEFTTVLSVVNITNIIPYANYTLCLRARNCGGLGPEKCITLIAPEAAPITPPTDLEATPGMTNVTLMWVAPEQPNGIVTYDYAIINSTDDIVISGMTMDLSVTINGLDVFTNYTFNVTARTSAGSTGPATGNFTTLEGVSSPIVNVTALNDQTVGQSLTLQCEVTTVRGITSGVDIVWSSNDIVLRRINGTTATTMDNSVVYTDSYTITMLSTSYDSRRIECEVTINVNPPIMASSNITLNVNVPDPNITISPPSPIVGAVVGSPLIAKCTVSTVDGVELSDVMIMWTGPGISTDRFNMGSIFSYGNNTFYRTLRLTYLIQTDESGTYFCIATILEASGTESLDVEALTVPSPTVNVTTLNDQTVGQSLTLQCEVTAVRGITSRVDIVWSSNDIVLKRINGTIATIMNDSLVYKDSYNISQLSISDDGRVIQCEVVINASPPVMATDNITLDVMGTTNISPELMDQTQGEGGTASFTCQATGQPVPNITWYFNGAPVDEANTMKYTVSMMSLNATTISSTVTIMSVQSSDVGTYICNATNVVSTDISSGVLTVNVAPTITTPMEGQQFNITEGSNGSITCTATGYPVPTVVWQNSNGSSLSNNRLVSGSPVNISSTGVGNVTSVSVELMMIGAMRVDSGMYRCSANNSINSTTRNVTIIVLFITNISPELMDQTQGEGDTASFTCQATGQPVPNITWYFNGAPVDEANTMKYTVSIMSLNATTISSTVTIMSVQSSDVGTYMCNATNVVSTDISSGVLTVNVAPTITTPMEGQQFNITEGSNGSITCTATGYPVPTVVWQNSDGSSLSNNRLVSGSPVNVSSTGVGNVTSVSVELMVIGAMRVDSGMYRCSANNSINSTTRDITLTVQSPTEAPRNIIVTVESSRSIMLSWERPSSEEEYGLLERYHVVVIETQIHYTDNGTEITGFQTYLNRTYNISEGRAQLIDNLHPDYNYTVRIAAATRVGIGPFSDPVTVRTNMDVPTEVPQNVTVTVESSRSIMLTWERPSLEEENGLLVRYHVIVIEIQIYYFDNGTEITGMQRYLNTTYDVSEGRMQLINESLYPDYNYTVRIAAATEPGIGPFSDAITVRTEMDVPTEVPQNVTVTVESSRSIMLTWERPPLEEENGLLVHYHVIVIETQIHYTDDGTEITGMQTYLNTTYEVSEGRMQVIDNLHPDYNYTVRIAAATEPGIGPFSDEITVRTNMDVPTEVPQNVTVTVESSRSIMLTWERPPLEEENGLLVHYHVIFIETQIHYTDNGTEITGMPTYFNLTYDVSEGRIQLIYGLFPDYNYTVRIAAATEVGIGPFSDAITVRTDMDELQPNITDITIIPSPNNDDQLLHEFNDTISLTCTAEGGPGIMTRWQFDDGSTVETVANDSSSVTYEISSLSTDHTGVYYCEAIIDGMTDTSMNYTLFVAPYNVSTMGTNIYLQGEQLMLYCLSEGGPELEYSWVFEGNNIANAPSLTINNVNASNEGDYTCNVTNDAGYESDTITIYIGVLITTHPQDELVGITDSVNFTCEASGSPPVNYRWLYNGDYIMDDPGHVEGVNSDTLMIVNVTVTDVGVYSCEANNIVNNATSNEATLHVAPYDVTIVANFTGDVMARPAVVGYGDTLALNCASSGGDDNIFQWYKDDIMLEENIDSILIITDVTADDGGLYECVVNSIAGNSSANITIYVTPRIITVPQSAEEFIGSAVNLSCSADGFPVPDITWLFQGMNFTSEPVSITNSTYTESTIVITDLMLNHGGIYSCEIDSPAVVASSSSSATLAVIGENVMTLMNESVFPGEYASWSCEVQSTIPLQFMWYLDDQLVSNVTGSHMNVIASSSYTLNNVNYSDDNSNVRCSVAGSELIVNSSDVYLTVLCPKITDITFNPSPSTNGSFLYEFNSNVSLTCTAEGGPRIMTRWQFDDGSTVETVANDSSSVTYEISSLSTDHTGVYYCEAIIDGMTDTSMNYTLDLLGPSPPQNFTVEVINSTAVEISWSYPDSSNGEILGYSILYAEFPDDMEILINITLDTIDDDSDQSYVIFNLLPFTQYSFRVRAFSLDDENERINLTYIGLASDEIIVRTDEGVPTAAPSNVTVTVESSHSIILSWEQPSSEEENGLLIGYHVIVIETQIHYTDNGTEITGMQTYLNRTYNVSEERTQLIDMLHPDYNYTVRIAAATGVGIGPFSDAITVRTHMDVPGPPENLTVQVLNFAVTLSWQPPLLTNGIIIFYTITYNGSKNEAQPGSQTEAISYGPFRYPANTTEITITNENMMLVLNSIYTFQVTASTSVGSGPPATSGLVVVPEARPIIIRSSGGDVVNRSIINDFVVNGTDTELSLTCTSVYQNEIVEWIRLNITGNVEQENSSNSQSSSITFAHPSEDFYSTFRCMSRNTLLYKDVFITKQNPYYRLLTNSTIYAPLASSPVISIIVAIDSDGTESQQDDVTDSLVLARSDNEDFIDMFEQDSDNFQLYHYMFPPLQRQNKGQYIIYSERNDEQLNILIEVNITTEELILTRSFSSVTLLEGSTVTLSCIPSVIETVLSWTHNGTVVNEDKDTTLSPMNLNHSLILDNTEVDDNGQYTCRAKLDDEIVEQNISVTVVPACANEFSGALFWINSRTNLLVTQSCSELHPNFRSGVQIGRQCNNDGNWSPVDMTNCTMFLNSNPVIIVYFTVIVSDSNTIDLVAIINNVLNQIQLSVVVVDSYNNSWSYRSDSNTLLLSITVSVSLQSTTVHTDTVNDIESNLRANASSVIPSGYVLTNESFMISAFQPNTSCLCNDTTNNTIQTICSGPSTAPCMCSSDCKCNMPTYVGDGRVCGLDSDSDGFPDESLDCDEPFCAKDLCPDIYSALESGEQSSTFCTSLVVIGGCPFGQDEMWNITWPATNASTTARQKCPGNSESQVYLSFIEEHKGIATRRCDQNGDWDSPDVSQCQTVEQIRLEMRAEELNDLVEQAFVDDDRDLTQTFMPEVVVDIADELNDITNTTTPLLPNDVTSTANTLNIIIFVTNITVDEVDQAVVSEVVEDAVDILDTLLDPRNDMSFESLDEEASEAAVSEQLLMNTEQVGVLLVSTLNTTNNETVKTISNQNIVIEAQIPTEEELRTKESIQFPTVTDMSTNDSLVFGSMTPMIEIPTIVVLRELEEGNEVPVINTVARNSRLPTNEGQRVESLILSSQISTNLQRVFLDGDTIQLTFNLGMQGNATRYNPRCAFFSFSSNRNESGRFSTDGITQSSTTNSTFVQCTSTHLTSFAVLVDASGETSDTTDHEALSIVSYIGCGISIACLLFTIVVLLTLRKAIFNQTHHFVHLNLSIALLLGLITFVSGIETANEYRESCLTVAILLHYFFMAAFCWMLCEGVLLFIMLYFVFYEGFLSRKRFFFALGWGLPIPIVATSAAISHEYYGINDRCWISEENGTIWAFIGPMLLIILVNSFFLITTLYQVYRTKQQKLSVKKSSRVESVQALLKAAVIVVPILGCTWVFGLLAINEDTIVFAWIFTIFNSLQGAFIMFFYVLRNDKFLKTVKCQTKDPRRTKSLSTSEKATLTKGSTMPSKTDDKSTILAQYNRYACNDYVTPASYVEDDYDLARIVSPNVFNVRVVAENFTFDENDEIQGMDEQQEESTSLSDIDPSHYLKHQQSAGIVYVNTASDKETKL